MNNNSPNEARQYCDREADAIDHGPDHGLSDPVVYDAWRELLIELLPTAPASILDVGCGTGSLSLVMAALGYDVTGIDLSPAMIARVKRKAETAGRQPLGVVLGRHLVWLAGSYHWCS